MFPLALSEAREWLAALRDFDGLYRSVGDNLVALERLEARAHTWPAAMQAERTERLRAGRALFGQLQALKATRDRVLGWLRAIGLAREPEASTGPPRRRSAPRLGSLGAVPLVVVGVGLGAFVAALLAAREWLTGTAGFARRLEAYDRVYRQLTAQGVPAAEASARASGAAKDLAGAAGAPGVLERLGSRVIWVGGGLVLLTIALRELARRQRARAR